MTVAIRLWGRQMIAAMDLSSEIFRFIANVIWTTRNAVDYNMNNRAAAFDIKGRKTSATLSVIFHFTHKTARQESSKFYRDLRNSSSLALTKYYCINFRCTAVTMPIKLSSYVTWITSETVASVQLPLNAMFFRHVEVVSHVILCDISAATLFQCIYTPHSY